jgi:methylmalonyl-CoA mutase N-terminal domain/subunit
MTEGMKGEEAADRVTLSGEPVAPLYTAENLIGWDASTALGDPGSYPFTRGVYPTMYRGRLWTMRQFAGFGSPVLPEVY